MKDKIRYALDIVVKHSKYIFPVLLVALSALTVVIALNASGEKQKRMELFESSESQLSTESVVPVLSSENKEVPLILNDDVEIEALIVSFFNARATGDEQGLKDSYDVIDDKDFLRWVATSKYTDCFSDIEIYTKPGFAEKETIAYVYFHANFTGKEAAYPGLQVFYVAQYEDGKLYLKNSGFTDEMNDYIKRVSEEADVVELKNRTKVEYDELMSAQPDLLAYLNEVDQLVGEEIGIRLGQIRAEEEAASQQVSEPEEETVSQENSQEEIPSQEAEPVVEYVIALDNVNVRNSDSTNAEIVGNVTKGTKLKLVEKLVNGWTKVIYNNKECYISSKYLEDVIDIPQVVEEPIGKVTAKGSVNVRSGPDTSYEKIGVLAGGESVEYYGKENGWVRVKFGGKTGYIKEDFVQ